MVILGIGNILQKDDGLGVYATTYLKKNYTFSKNITIINGGVEGINLFSIFEESSNILILDALQLDDEPTSIYLIPSTELSGHGLNSGGAHEIGVLQCLDMLELQGKPQPNATILGMIPHHVTFDIALSDTIKEAFNGYIQVALKFLKKEGIEATLNETILSLEEIIRDVRKI
jgi:hydrogenase maturation protease